MLPIILLVLGLILWLLAARARRGAGLPAGRVVYADMREHAWARPEKALFSKTLGLTGKPDYLVQHKGRYIPVEVKSGQAPPDGPHAAHVYQLAAYCALVAENYGRRPDYGLIKYADQTMAVDYTRTLEAELRHLLEQMRSDSQAADVWRSHQSPARCRGCGFREVCDKRLA